MTKINQIQQALLALGGGEFQKLADVYLAEKGFGPLNSLGSVVGASKVVHGTPDTLIPTADGGFIFAEHTTQQTGLFTKVESDLRKCFEEDKTGVPLAKIERIMFCHTGGLSGKEVAQVKAMCEENEIALELFGIDTISIDLYRHYPGIARDFLGIQIDSGQIVSPDRFVSLYNDGKLATRLDLTFHFREQELSSLLAALEEEDLVILTGKAGVGKSRLALEGCRRFKDAHPDYEVMCIFGRNRDLWGDLRSTFSRPGSFLVLVDDANRVSRFEYVTDLLEHLREDQRIKVVATVRDYAVSTVREAAIPLGGGVEIDLDPFTDEEIKELITDEYGITNHLYLERIGDVSRGNPRLAVMAAQIAKEQSLSGIIDVSTLYDSYFSSIRNDLAQLGTDVQTGNLLKVAAIVSFFRAVDRANEGMMGIISDAFGIPPATFWEAADLLHGLEILDMYENEVVRVSDQVLGTYLFYLATFKEDVLNFGDLLEHFFPDDPRRLVGVLNPVLNAFDSQTVTEAIRPHVDRVWADVQDVPELALRFLDLFWFVRRTATLLWIKERIDGMDGEPIDESDISYEKSTAALPTPSILSVLRPFARVETSEAQTAVGLLTRYLEKRPSEVPYVLRVLIEDFGFHPESHLRRFEVQRAVVDSLWDWAATGDLEPFFGKVFIAIANEYLRTEFETSRMKDTRVFQLTRFELPLTEELTELREGIWKKLFTLHTKPALKDDVIGLIRGYSTSHWRTENTEVLKQDASLILPFLEAALDPAEYADCVVVHSYLDLLERHELGQATGLRQRFRNETLSLAEVLIPNRNERPRLELSFEEYEQYKLDRIAGYTEQYAFEEYAELFDRCMEIQRLADDNGRFRLKQGVESALLGLANRNPALYERVVDHYLDLEDPLGLHGHQLIRSLVDLQGYEATLSFLRSRQAPAPMRWLFSLHEVVPTSEMDDRVLEELYALYRDAEPTNLPHRMDFLLEYVPLDREVVAKVTTIILEKVDQDSSCGTALLMMFNPHADIADRLPELFDGHLAVLKRAYLAVDATKNYADHDGKAFDCLLDLDSSFISAYIDGKFQEAEKGWMTGFDDTRDYGFIWNRDDHREIMERAVNTTYAQEQDRYSTLKPYLGTFFQNTGSDDGLEASTRERQDKFLSSLIDEGSDDDEFMAYLFAVIAQFSAPRRRQFVEHFVSRNDRFETFEGLPLEPNSWSAQGSWVPVLQRRIDFWESLLPIMSTPDLLPHKQYIEQRIDRLGAELDHEKKSDFVEG